MYVQPISTFRLFQEGHLPCNSIAIFVLTTLFYWCRVIGSRAFLAEWRNGGVFARYVWLNRSHYHAIARAMLAYDATTGNGAGFYWLSILQYDVCCYCRLTGRGDKARGKISMRPVSALGYSLFACRIIMRHYGAIGLAA